jgi:benzylsuccinate CoA-transferase BbsF subunit
VLTGVRVLDFGWVWAGAVPGQVLAFLGAEVIKVETRKRLDYMRQGRPIVDTAPNTEQQPMFHNINRGKLSLSVDMTAPEGRELLLDLAALCDVAIENFSAGVLDRYGLGYERLRERRPDLVMLSMSGGGQTGPLREMRSYASTIAAYSGLDSLCGYPGEEPLGVQQSYPDPNASLHGALAILAALMRRQRTGRGDHIDLSQLAAGLMTVGEAMAAMDLFGEVPQCLGNAPPNDEPVHDCFQCTGDDQWVAVAAGTPEELAALARLLAVSGADIDAVRSALAAWCRERSPQEAMEQLQAVGVPAGAATTAADRFQNPHYRARGTYIETEHPSIGWEMVYREPWLWPHEVTLANNRAPLMGEHNEYVVRELLGRSREEYERLVERQVLH